MQGYWPDGIYTAPTDVALKSDIVTSKALGFNTLRKHVKVEPDRWCVLPWQTSAVEVVFSLYLATILFMNMPYI